MKHRLLTLFVLLALLLTFLPAQTVHAIGGRVLYVDDDSACIGLCGDSWANAYKNLQAALSAAASSDQIWVAEGVYYPGGHRTSTFTLKNEVAVYGGFKGTETQVDQRNPAANPTI